MPVTKNDLENAKQDKLNRDEREGYEKELKRQKEENEAPRKAVSDAYNYVKGKASELGDTVSRYAKEYGDVYKKGLGMKKGGSVKSASARADGCAIRGKTRA